jgi:hypothetical protein
MTNVEFSILNEGILSIFIHLKGLRLGSSEVGRLGGWEDRRLESWNAEIIGYK